jgi:hypothetical protein
MKPLSTIGMMIILLASMTVIASAQQAATATLSGRVLDPNRAVIPGATVTAMQKTTGVKRESTTNDEGTFVVTNLPVDEYEVKVQAKNFKC